MSAGTLLVIGRNSYLARELAARHPDLLLRSIGHDEAGREASYDGAECVVNFAFAPALHDAPYERSMDIDAVAAPHAAARGMHYVMISSRRVYQRGAQWNAHEAIAAEGLDTYGRNKLRIESSLRDLLGERLTVLRPGNIFGYEPIPGRPRFAAYLQNQLLDTGNIRLTVSPALRRDLVPAAFFCRALREAVLRRRPGVFNVGAGRATAIGDAAGWLIAGFGAGEVVVESDVHVDEFQLDVSNFSREYGLSCGKDEVEHAFLEYGRLLAAEKRRRASPEGS